MTRRGNSNNKQEYSDLSHGLSLEELDAFIEETRGMIQALRKAKDANLACNRIASNVIYHISENHEKDNKSCSCMHSIENILLDHGVLDATK